MKKRYCLVVDYGHGIRYYTLGKRSADGRIYEGEWNREVGKRILAGMRELGLECIELVPEDTDVPLSVRCARVNKLIRENPDVEYRLLSVHIDAANSKSCDKYGWCDTASGCSGHIYLTASEESLKMAQCYYDMVEQFGLKGNRSVPKERAWRDNYAILRETKCPAVLTENMFMTNHKDVDFLTSEKGKETIVNMHIAALCKYFGIPYGIAKA